MIDFAAALGARVRSYVIDGRRWWCFADLARGAGTEPVAYLSAIMSEAEVRRGPAPGSGKRLTLVTDRGAVLLLMRGRTPAARAFAARVAGLAVAYAAELSPESVGASGG